MAFHLNPSRFTQRGALDASAAGDPNWANVVLLAINDNAGDGATTFTDQSTAAHTLTANGNAQYDTAQAPTGMTSSGLFDGTGDSVTADGSSDFAFGTGDFTIEGFFRASALGDAAGNLLYDSRTADGFYPTIATLGGASSATLIYYVNSAVRITGTTVVSTGTWYHFALARSGTSTKLFLAGTQEGSTWSDSSTYLNAAARPMIGGNGANSGVPFWKGWISNLRVTKGVARYTANFTPPTLPMQTS